MLTLIALASGASPPPMLTYKQWSEKTGSTDRELYNLYDTKVRSLYDAKGRSAVAPKSAPKNAGDVLKVTWDSFTTLGAVTFAWTLAGQGRQKVSDPPSAPQVLWALGERSTCAPGDCTPDAFYSHRYRGPRVSRHHEPWACAGVAYQQASAVDLLQPALSSNVPKMTSGRAWLGQLSAASLQLPRSPRFR